MANLKLKKAQCTFFHPPKRFYLTQLVLTEVLAASKGTVPKKPAHIVRIIGLSRMFQAFLGISI